MCTLTWRVEPDGYQIFFNRDERRERRPETPPATRCRGDLRFLAPLDGDHGGTWIAVNQHGISLCLLNGFPAEGPRDPAPPTAYRSRGAIPLEAIGCKTVDDVAQTVHDLELAEFRPFVLVAIGADGRGLRLRWSGRELGRLAAPPTDAPLVSSSFCTADVRQNREAVYARIVASADDADPTARHLAFHASHVPAAGPYSTCMHRDDASTVSFSRIEVRPADIRFHYVSHSPCRGLPRTPVARLERHGAQ